VIAIAGEGIELPIATEHNRRSIPPAAVKQGVRKYFTPVVGNEVTTNGRPFQCIPAPRRRAIPDFKLKDWKSLFASIDQAGAKITILNHARESSCGFRPFAPSGTALSGERRDGMELRANAMEVVNSGAHQTDVMRLFRDWVRLLTVA